MLRRLRFAFLVVPAVVLAAGAFAQPAVPPDQPLPASTADHAKFDELDGPFASGPEVTKACLACHAGYGWEDEETFDVTDQTAMDCVVCHDTTGTDVKAPAGASRPVLDEPVTHYGETLEPVDLARGARNVGPTSAETCGSCHFYGGGGDNVKHGDLSSALVDPPVALDVGARRVAR